jgi:hypothetical protein
MTYDYIARVLFHSKVTHSFISTMLVTKLEIEPKELRVYLTVSTSIGIIPTFRCYIENVLIQVQEQLLLRNCILLDM